MMKKEKIMVREFVTDPQGNLATDGYGNYSLSDPNAATLEAVRKNWPPDR